MVFMPPYFVKKMVGVRGFEPRNRLQRSPLPDPYRRRLDVEGLRLRQR